MKESKIILINKEKDISSFKKIREIQKEYNFSKIGHAGTLDPLAEGLLIAMSNNATKLSDLLMKKDKIYYVKMLLSFETDTLDLEGNVIYKDEENQKFTLEKIKEVLNSFIGAGTQIPPMYSAIKINGQKMCDLARKNIQIDIPKRQIHIYRIWDVEYNIDLNEISFKVEVSSGTYIRSLVRDIAHKLGTFGTMSYLFRKSIAQFVCPDSVKIIDIDECLDYEKIKLYDEDIKKLKNGQSIKVTDIRKNKAQNLLNCYHNLEYKGIIEVISVKNNVICIRKTKFFSR